MLAPACTALVAALVVATMTVSGMAQETPNILFLMADQMRGDLPGASGNTFSQTPHLDALAADGAFFTRAFSSTPTCTPARAAILTGLRGWHNGVIGLGNISPWYRYPMPRALASHGYQTGVVGKDHFGWNRTSDTGIGHGYQYRQIYDGIGTGLPDRQFCLALCFCHCVRGRTPGFFRQLALAPPPPLEFAVACRRQKKVWCSSTYSSRLP
eukprot:m.77267 g.77267  ORF g.77267 m.77267 type:complete len:212 (-) comp8133_c0_seq2:543-1178(-)